MNKILIMMMALLFAPCQMASAQQNDKYGPVEDVLKYNQSLPDFKTLHQLAGDKSKPIIWVITGDSITHGAMHTHGWRSYPEHWMERVKWEMRRLDDIVIDSGISGEITTGLLKQFDWRIGQFKPSVVSINLGVNDCTKMGKAQIGAYKKNLEELVSKVRKLKAIPILQVPNTLATGQGAQILPEFSRVIREVAVKNKVLLVDHEYHWKKYVTDETVRKAWMNDAVHPNGKGHMEMFKKMAADLGFFDQNSPACKLGDRTIQSE